MFFKLSFLKICKLFIRLLYAKKTFIVVVVRYAIAYIDKTIIGGLKSDILIF